MRKRLMKHVAMMCCGGILLSIQCPPLVMQSIKTGVISWVGGGAVVADLSQLGDLLLGGFLGGLHNSGT